MSEQPSPSSLTRRAVRLERRQWDRLASLAARAGVTVASALRSVVDLGSDALERDLTSNGGQQS